MPKKVLVFGAGGFLGEHVVAQLVAAGHTVLAVVRPGYSKASPSSRVQLWSGDILDRSFVRTALDSVDAVVFSAGRTWRPGLELGQYQQHNVSITQAFFEALHPCQSTRVVFTSSLSTIGGSAVPIIYAEGSGRGGICETKLSPYDRAKIECEQIAVQRAAGGNNVVILNPGLMLGPGASATSNLAAPFCLLWFLQGQFAARFFVNGGVTLCDVRDVAAAHVAALELGNSGERYILGGHNLDRRAFYERAARLVGRRMPQELPGSLLTGLTTISDGLTWLTAGRVTSPVHRSFARTQPLYYFGESQKAVSELGYLPRPLEQTMLDMIQHYQSRSLLSARFQFPVELTLETAPLFAMLRQLVDRSRYQRTLRERLPELFHACQSNHQLRDALTHLLSISQFNARRGKYRWEHRSAKSDLQVLRKFLEYVYFGSSDFLRKVL